MKKFVKIEGEGKQQQVIDVLECKERQSPFTETEVTEYKELTKRVQHFKVHYGYKNAQLGFFESTRSKLALGECLIVIDFKENLKLGMGGREIGEEFYHRTQVRCLRS